MHKPPRNLKRHVISNTMWMGIVIVGIIMAGGTLFVMDWSLPGGLVPGNGSIRYAQTMAFTTLVLAQLCNVLNARSDEVSACQILLKNRWLWLAILLSLLLQITVVYVPALERAFGTVPLQITDWVFCLVVASMVLWGREMTKLIARLARRGSLPGGRVSSHPG